MTLYYFSCHCIVTVNRLTDIVVKQETKTSEYIVFISSIISNFLQDGLGEI